MWWLLWKIGTANSLRLPSFGLTSFQIISIKQMKGILPGGRLFHSVLMSPLNHHLFMIELALEFLSIEKRVCNVEMENAQSFNPVDREKIFKAVQTSVGFAELNKQVIGDERVDDSICNEGPTSSLRKPKAHHQPHKPSCRIASGPREICGGRNTFKRSSGIKPA